MPERLSNVPMVDLVPETRDWNEGRGIDPRSWISCIGSFEQAIGYGELFWPDFRELDDCVFFAGVTEENYRGFMEQTGGNKRAVETVLNHRHIIDLFSARETDPSVDQFLYLGRLIREMWAAKLAHDYPKRRFMVSFPEEGLESLQDFEVTFFQG
jgi:hypothetical protein